MVPRPAMSRWRLAEGSQRLKKGPVQCWQSIWEVETPSPSSQRLSVASYPACSEPNVADSSNPLVCLLNSHVHAESCWESFRSREPHNARLYDVALQARASSRV